MTKGTMFVYERPDGTLEDRLEYFPTPLEELLPTLTEGQEVELGTDAVKYVITSISEFDSPHNGLVDLVVHKEVHPALH